MSRATKEEIERQAAKIERELEEEPDTEEEVDSDEDELLARQIKRNAANKAENYTFLYIVASMVTTACPVYLFATVLDLSPLDPINAAVYAVAGAATMYFLVESYKQMYATEAKKASGGESGQLLSTLERRLNDRVDSMDPADVRDGALPSVPADQHKPRTAQELFHAGSKTEGSEWKVLSDEEAQKYKTAAAQEEVQILRRDVAELGHLITQRAMGWTLFFSNGVFIALSVFMSFGLLRSYDNRVNFAVSTILIALFVQLLAKNNDEAARTRLNKQK
eukprot:TRINITY_DN9293_c0_g1_i1.p1 TRINITY_DN9293_c0_g1~~TRINITY_DN9293_c0_g1_i1.p1  ORF type:complete len:278 (+),score=142.31 TRINITY_DN9293_c0_g1_i1:73-906(+)